ncbi:hypothetical protein ABPG72_000570 [Tetrahymena utriculariae]
MSQHSKQIIIACGENGVQLIRNHLLNGDPNLITDIQSQDSNELVSESEKNIPFKFIDLSYILNEIGQGQFSYIDFSYALLVLQFSNELLSIKEQQMCLYFQHLLGEKKENMCDYLWVVIIGCQNSSIFSDFIDTKLKQIQNLGLNVNKNHVINYQMKNDDLIPFLNQVTQYQQDQDVSQDQIKQKVDYFINIQQTYLQSQNQQELINRDTKTIIQSQLESLGLSTSKQLENSENKEEQESEELKKIFSEIDLPRLIFSYGDQKLREQMNSQLILKEGVFNSKLNINENSSKLMNQEKIDQLMSNINIPEMNGTFEEFSTQIYNQKTQIELIDQQLYEPSDLKNIEKVSEDFIEDNKIELETIYIYKDKKALQNVLQVPQSQTEFTQKDKYTMLFPDDTNLKQEENQDEQELSRQIAKKRFYTKLYFYLKLQKFEKCLEDIFRLVSSPQSDTIFDFEVISKIFKYIKRHTENQELLYLIDVFDSTDLDQMDCLFEKYVQIIKEKTCMPNENLEEAINQTSLVIFRSALNFKQLKENQKNRKINKSKEVTQSSVKKINNVEEIQFGSTDDNKNLIQSLIQNNKEKLNDFGVIQFEKADDNKNLMQSLAQSNIKKLNNVEVIQFGNEDDKKSLIQSLIKTNLKQSNDVEDHNKNLLQSLTQNNKEKQQQYTSKNELHDKNEDILQYMLNSLKQSNIGNQDLIRSIVEKDKNQKDKLQEDDQKKTDFHQNLENKDAEKIVVKLEEAQQVDDGQNQDNETEDEEDEEEEDKEDEEEEVEVLGKLQGDLQIDQDKKIKDEQKKCLLTLDGGGVKGIVQLFFLSTLESITGKQCDDIFYFIGGTSIGGIIALGLRMRIYAKDLLKIIIRHFQDNLFSQNLIKNIFNAVIIGKSLNPNSSLHEILKQRIFKDKCFSDIKKNTLITSAYLDSDQTIIPVCFVRFSNESQGTQKSLNVTGLYRVEKQFNNYLKPVKFIREFQDVKFKKAPLWQIAASTSAAFPYLNKFKFDFEKRKNLEHEFVDGGYLLNNVDILLIEFLKQKDKSYNQINKLSQYYLLSISTQYASIDQKNPPFKEFDTDKRIKLPSSIIKAKIFQQWDEIQHISQKNQDQSVFLTILNENNEKFKYQRLQPISYKEVALNEATLETLDYLQQISHKFLSQNQGEFKKMIAQLDEQTDINIIQSQIENLEILYPKDYVQLNELISSININRIKSEFQNFEEYYMNEGSKIETCLVDILLQIKIRNNKVQIKKMTDYKFYQVLYYYKKNKNAVYYESKFKGAIQLAASIGSVTAIQKIFDILQSFNQDIEESVITQFGDCKWNALIAASANEMVRTFIYLLMSIQDLHAKSHLLERFGCQTFYQVKDEEKNKLLKDIVYSPCKEKYYYQSQNHTHYVGISNQKFRDLIDWWIN